MNGEHQKTTDLTPLIMPPVELFGVAPKSDFEHLATVKNGRFQNWEHAVQLTENVVIYGTIDELRDAIGRLGMVVAEIEQEHLKEAVIEGRSRADASNSLGFEVPKW